ncbi:MAG: alpha-galactosidase [Eubacteriales bacterium]|nr:alpha-galactosidase [Eubacteriales bacterium]
MGICYDSDKQIFSLTTRDTLYQMQLGPVGHLLHLYYGPKTDCCFDYLQLDRDCGFSPNPYDHQEGRGWSLDTKAQEYSSQHAGDYRVCSLSLETDAGLSGTDLRYVNYKVFNHKYEISGMPSAFGKAQSLSITLADAATGVEVELLYGVFEKENVITRAVRVKNAGTSVVTIEKAASACLDLPFGGWQLLHFHGRHTMERAMERRSLMNGIQTVSSTRGASSHQHNPFVILCQPETTEDFGECYGMMLVYSGNHRTDIELDQSGSVRAVMGIHDDGFRWTLNPGEVFETPEVLMTFTDKGLTSLSQTYHKFIQHHICRSRFALERRPVLLNSWEAAYMDISEGKLLSIAKGAKDLGVELFVIDDGWFGQRDDDFRSLGDWFPNKKKFPGGLTPTLQKIRDLGLKVGLWVEPEMVNEDSGLYRAHPDWALTVPGRNPTMSRSQLVLDMSRADVVDWLYETLSTLLRENPIDYIKWDMNRNLADVYSRALPAARQGEVSHRFVLGYYDLMERLTREFPDVLFEGCAGGGGRFDAGVLAYSPQIWCSDNTDPIARLTIQHGTSFGYPIACMGSHVSASPNHQTGRSTPLHTRSTVAMAGTFGYELDPAALTEEEKETVRAQIARFHELQDLIREGDYYRLSDGSAWELVSEDKKEALLSFVLVDPTSNPKPNHIRLKGLVPEARYRVAWADFGGKASLPHEESRTFTGTALMRGGYTLPILFGDYPAVQILFKQI